MLHDLIPLLASFFIILLGSETFTNGIEWAGEKLGVAEAAVGSLLAAVGTALPETFIPAVALITGLAHPGGAHNAVGVGAIVGAPLMLSTIALMVMGVAGLWFRKRRGRIALRVAREDARRDLLFFLPVFIVAISIGTLFALGPAARMIAAFALLGVYAIYSWVMLTIERDAEAAVEHGLYLESILGGDGLHPRAVTTAIQVLAGVALILFGAREFVERLVSVAGHAGVNAGVLSLILSPLATELPEKYNSVIWIRQGKDHLALANITGAMVFQSCIPVALGLAMTPWRLTTAEIVSAGVTIASAAILYGNLRDSEIGTPTLMIGGVAYAVFIAGLLLIGTI